MHQHTARGAAITAALVAACAGPLAGSAQAGEITPIPIPGSYVSITPIPIPFVAITPIPIPGVKPLPGFRLPPGGGIGPVSG